MAEAKFRGKDRKVLLTLSLTEARYVYSALSNCSPIPVGLFYEGQYRDPVYEALGDLFSEAGINDNVGLAMINK